MQLSSKPDFHSVKLPHCRYPLGINQDFFYENNHSSEREKDNVNDTEFQNLVLHVHVSDNLGYNLPKEMDSSE